MSYEFSETDGGHDWTPLTFSEILQFRRCSSRLAPNRGGSNCDAEPARRKSHGVDPEAGRRRMPWAYDGQHGHASEHGLLHHRDNAGGTHPRTPPRIARIPCPELRVLASGTESSNPLPSSGESGELPNHVSGFDTYASGPKPPLGAFGDILLQTSAYRHPQPDSPCGGA
jgi:hypothetical protein